MLIKTKMNLLTASDSAIRWIRWGGMTPITPLLPFETRTCSPSSRIWQGRCAAGRRASKKARPWGQVSQCQYKTDRNYLTIIWISRSNPSRATFSHSLAILDEFPAIQACFCSGSIASAIQMARRILSAACGGVKLLQFDEQARMTRRTTKSNVLRPRFGPKKCRILRSHDGASGPCLLIKLSFRIDAMRANVARHKRLPIWSSRLRRVFVNSTCIFDMTSVGTSCWRSEHPWSPFIKVCKGAIVSALGLRAMEETRHVIRSASRAGGTSPIGNGFDSKEMHASRYCFYVSFLPKWYCHVKRSIHLRFTTINGFF